MRTIYLDMDGVVADFNLYVSEILGRTIGWEGRDITDAEWNTLVTEHPNLYGNLPVVKGSEKLVNLAKSYKDFDVKFLTAIPRRTSMPSAEMDKQGWVKKYFPDIPMLIGPYSVDKQKWAKPGDILVDDKKSNIEQWVSKGGIGVRHFYNLDHTVTNLRRAVEIPEPFPPVLFGLMD
jgi:5'(3')-deoxyribonucleotidase